MDTVTANECDHSEKLKDLASIARMVTYARGQLNQLNAQFATYCLDLALGSILEEMEKNGMENIVADDASSKIGFMRRN